MRPGNKYFAKRGVRQATRHRGALLRLGQLVVDFQVDVALKDGLVVLFGDGQGAHLDGLLCDPD